MVDAEARIGSSLSSFKSDSSEFANVEKSVLLVLLLDARPDEEQENLRRKAVVVLLDVR